MDTKDLSYQNHPIKWSVSILSQDISDKVTSVSNTRQSLDISNLTEIEAGAANIQVRNEDNDFSTDRDSNFFTRYDFVKTGYFAPIEVKAGFDVNGTVTDETIFWGYVNRIDFNKKTKTATIEAIDKTTILRRDNLVNFGLQKSSRLGFNTAGTSIQGEYPFDDAVTPVSDESVFPFLNGNIMKNVSNLEGIEYEQTNFALNDARTAIETQVATSNPTDLITALYKAPFKYSQVKQNALDIISRYFVKKKRLSIGGVNNIDFHFDSLGKVQYSTTQSGVAPNPTEQFEYKGFITDFTYDESTSNFYLLESSFDQTVFPRLIQYNLIEDRYRILFTAPAHFEWWLLATGDFNTFYIGQTTGTWVQGRPNLGAYNSSETGVQTSIRQYNVTTSTDQTFNTSGTNRLQLAYYYHYGFNPQQGGSIRGDSRYGFRGDSRFGFIFYNTRLYFRFANTTNFGLASMTSSGTIAEVITIPRDNRNNEASFDFTINPSSGVAYGSHTRRDRTESVHMVYEKSL